MKMLKNYVSEDCRKNYVIEVNTLEDILELEKQEREKRKDEFYWGIILRKRDLYKDDEYPDIEFEIEVYDTWGEN